MRVEDSENGKWSFLPKHSSTLFIWVCILEYLPHVDTAREVLQFLTNSDTTFGGRFNFSKVEGVYPPIPVYLGSCTTLIEDLTPGATLVKRIIIKWLTWSGVYLLRALWPFPSSCWWCRAWTGRPIPIESILNYSPCWGNVRCLSMKSKQFLSEGCWHWQ